MNVEIVGNAATSIAVTGAPGGELSASLQEWLGDAVREHGAAMVRGLELGSAQTFREVVGGLGRPLLDSYKGGDTPRTALSEGVFTSTDYPARYPISQHNEMSYAATWPGHLYFGCLWAAETGGGTPISNGAALLEALDPALRSRFEARDVLYQQVLHDGDGPGRSWQETFETTDPGEVEAHLRATSATYESTDDGGFRVRQVRPALRTHPVSGREVWFNQAEQWHPSSIPGLSDEVVEEMADDADELPRWSSYGDGEPFSADDLARVRAAANDTAVCVPWRVGDLLMVDNMAVLHGRQPFTGSRTIVVAMT